MSEELVLTRRNGAVFEVTLNRPKANAINRAMSRAIYAALKTLLDDPAASVGIVTGAGERIFSAGWDLKEEALDYDPDLDADPERGNGPGGFAGITEFWGLTKPVIAAVNGAAVGGGFEIALACDVILMAENAFFQLPEMQRGILPDAGAIQRLPRLIPPNVAREMLLTGRRMEPDEALRWGLVHKVVPQNRLMDEARALAAEIAKGAPLALRALKEVLAAIDGMPLPQAMAKTKPGRSGLPLYERMMRSEDMQEGMRAFAEKREPRWKGK
jgi:crotonobetainyl-CoA hydratase